ncbi:NAD(P)-dependent alcohol dehydrogenase [Amycolatopsis anabasis]|uniref:NAD(P)-dependent alcohol dehydrogenase n=1 Tax=Amycolatopsis anabasis TaxID=1840409 RepID=UPI00131AA1C3|nr:NAD(P)-dependent alcohol dehydrogenase [Amycolatopsis anabasis]
MRAVRLNAWKSDPVRTEIPIPEPGPGQVLIQVGGAGACHSDLHLMREFGTGSEAWEPPFTLGHENAGWVHTLGDGVRGWEPGQPVAVVGAWGCGRCARCRAGVDIYCEDPAAAPVPGGGGGLGLDGGMADYLLVPAERFLVPLPDGLDPVHAAPITDAALTPYHAIRRSLPKLTPDAIALVIGAGGLGHLGVQLLKTLTGARVVVVEPRESAGRLAARSGADLVLAPGSDTVALIRDFTSGRGVDLALDFVGSDETIATAAKSARPLGDVTIVGIAGGSFPVSFTSLPPEVSVQTTYWGTRAELVELFDLAARGLLTPEIEVFDLDDALTAYRRLEAGDVRGRAVIAPSATYSG